MGDKPRHGRTSRRLCVALDLDYVLSLPAQQAQALLQTDDGRSLSAQEVWTHATLLKARGFAVMPLGCNNHDNQGRCLGHLPEGGASGEPSVRSRNAGYRELGEDEL